MMKGEKQQWFVSSVTCLRFEIGNNMGILFSETISSTDFLV
jgi:hypothetical protein